LHFLVQGKHTVIEIADSAGAVHELCADLFRNVSVELVIDLML